MTCFQPMPTPNLLVRKYFFLATAVFWTLLIAVLCLVRFSKLPSLGIGSADKYVHVIFHCGFMITWFTYFRNANAGFDKILLRLFIASFVYGIAIEIAQELFTATRQADIYDVMANMTGAFLGISIIMIGNYFGKRK